MKIVLLILLLYLVAGVFIGPYILIKKMKNVDPNLNETSFFVKLFLTPGSIVFWPVLLNKIRNK
jgi:uncharacterized protein YneF (UPF0154 family)